LTEEYLTTEEVKKLFTAKDNEGRTAFHSAANSKRLMLFRGEFESAKNNLATE
jgi:hypothetical protein